MDLQYAHSYGQPSPNYAPKYVMLDENKMGIHVPPGRRHLPRYYSKKNYGGDQKCNFGCLCWCCCFFLVFLIAVVGIIGYAFILLDPKTPEYTFDHIEVLAFDVRQDFSLHTEISIIIKAVNPNRNIAISYGKDSTVVVHYKGAELCSGKLPAFFQGHRSTELVEVVLEGDSTFGSALYDALLDNQKSKHIPLDVYVKVPVVVSAWVMHSKVITVVVKCDLVVDSLVPNNNVRILSADYKVKLHKT